MMMTPRDYVSKLLAYDDYAEHRKDPYLLELFFTDVQTDALSKAAAMARDAANNAHNDGDDDTSALTELAEAILSLVPPRPRGPGY